MKMNNRKLNLLQLPAGEPFAVGINVPVPSPSFALQKLTKFTLLFVHKGSAQIELDFYMYTLEAGCHLILGEGLYFQCLKASPDFTVSYITFNSDIWFEITTSFNPSFFAFLKQYPISPKLSKEKKEGNQRMMEFVYNIYMERDHTFRMPIFKNCMQNFLMDIYDKAKGFFLHHNASNTTRQEELLEKFIFLVFQHSGTCREVQFYADQLCITTRYLSSIIQNLTGHTPKNHIDTRCIQEIKTQLRTTNKSMQEIAFELNFPDQSFFTRYFKKHTGLTPVEYRHLQESQPPNLR